MTDLLPLISVRSLKHRTGKVECMFGCMPPRDILLTVGKEMLEATMSYRCRWFEYLCYRPLLERYFEEDPEMKWESAPKPRLTEESYKPGYKDRVQTEEDRLKLMAAKDFVTTEVEVLFDAAECLRMGKDLFVQHGMTANLKGIEWIGRHFSDHRVHAVNFPTDPYPIHIDATFVALRPGLIINNPVRALPKEQRKIFEINDWQILDAAQPAHKEPPPLCYSSVWLSMNVLSLDPKTVCVEASEVHQMEQFDKLEICKSCRCPLGMLTHLVVASTVQRQMSIAKVRAKIISQNRHSEINFVFLARRHLLLLRQKV